MLTVIEPPAATPRLTWIACVVPGIQKFPVIAPPTVCVGRLDEPGTLTSASLLASSGLAAYVNST